LIGTSKDNIPQKRKKKRLHDENMQYIYQDLGDNFRLAQRPEREREAVRDREHDGDLHGEQRQREVEGVLALPHPVRRHLHGRRGRRRRVRRHSVILR